MPCQRGHFCKATGAPALVFRCSSDQVDLLDVPFAEPTDVTYWHGNCKSYPSLRSCTLTVLHDYFCTPTGMPVHSMAPSVKPWTPTHALETRRRKCFSRGMDNNAGPIPSHLIPSHSSPSRSNPVLPHARMLMLPEHALL